MNSRDVGGDSKIKMAIGVLIGEKKVELGEAEEWVGEEK